MDGRTRFKSGNKKIKLINRDERLKIVESNDRLTSEETRHIREESLNQSASGLEINKLRFRLGMDFTYFFKELSTF